MPKIDVSKVKVRKGSGYPKPFRDLARNRTKQALGAAAGLKQFGVNLVRLPPGEWSSQRHWHTSEDEFVYIIEGTPTLMTDAGAQKLKPGDCCGFAKGVKDGHCLINKSKKDVVYLEIGSRVKDDICEYPDIDMRSLPSGYTHKDGTPY